MQKSLYVRITLEYDSMWWNFSVLAAAANALECMKSTKSYLACFWPLILKMGNAITEEFFFAKTSFNLFLILAYIIFLFYAGHRRVESTRLVTVYNTTSVLDGAIILSGFN